MITAKSLSDDQIAAIKTWAEEGDALADIQRKMNSEMELKATYLETRFLLEDLGIELKPDPVPEPEEVESEPEIDQDEAEAVQADAAQGDPSRGDPSRGDPSRGEGAGHAATVTIDKIQRPGALVSGKVTFAGGKSSAWWLDQMGRLGMEPEEEGFQPTEDQMLAFQKELQVAIQQSGL
ncbi:MAG: hypothetical protein WD342_15955 [Verrucomicrobiales bacterium]